MIITLEPMQRQTIAARGETVVYLSGSEPLLIEAKGKRAEIPSTSQVRFETFDEVTFQNKGGITAEFEVFIVEGEFRSLAEGSKVITDIANTSEIATPIVMALGETLDIRQITETLTTNVINTVTANIANTVDIRQITETLTANVVNTVTANIANTVDIRQITETLTADISNTSAISDPIVTALSRTLETQEKAATSLSTSQMTLTAGEIFKIQENEKRRDIKIMAAETNTDVVTVAGIPLRSGQYVELTKYTGAVDVQAFTANEIIFITEVIK